MRPVRLSVTQSSLTVNRSPDHAGEEKNMTYDATMKSASFTFTDTIVPPHTLKIFVYFNVFL